MQNYLSENQWQDRAISLAGIFHAVDLVNQLATSGYLNSQDFKVSMQSIFILQPDTVESVYGNAANILRGLEVLERVLTHYRSSENTTILRYAIGLLHLQKKLSNDKKMLNTLSHQLELNQERLKHFDITHDNIITSLAETYSQTISTFSFRIHVTGEYHYLQQNRVANQVRALLLAGIRAAMLWRQTRGSKWQILFQKKTLLEATQHLIAHSKKTLH